MSMQSATITGTDEMRFLIFRLQQTPFAINVLNIREIIKQVRTNEIPNAPWGIAGVFKLRDEVIPLVRMCEYLGYEAIESANNDGAIIIVENSGVKYGILVDAVDVIKAVGGDQVQDPSEYIRNTEAPVIGTIEIEKKTVQIPDLEKITGELFNTENKQILEQSGATVESASNSEEDNRIDRDGTPAFDELMKDIPVEDLKETPQLAEKKPAEQTAQWKDGAPSFNSMMENISGDLDDVDPELKK